MTKIISGDRGIVVIRLDNGKCQASGEYNGSPWTTEEADDPAQAKQFAYFILNQLSANAINDPIPEKAEA